MVHVGPGVLQHGAHLDLETVGETLHAADIVQGHVAEAVYLMRLALVHGILPVHLEETVHGRCHLVHVVAVEGDDTHAHYICDVR